MKIYHCEDSLEGIFTAIYNTYEDHCIIRDTMVTTIEENLLFSESVEVVPDPEKTVKVIRTLKRRFGEEDYESLCLALSSPKPEKAQAVYRTIAKGLSEKCPPGHLLDAMADTYVNQTFSLARGAGNEYHHLKGFTRFEELENTILYSKIAPKNNILTFLMVHFADRFPMKTFWCSMQAGICSEYIRRESPGIRCKGRMHGREYSLRRRSCPRRSCITGNFSVPSVIQ